MESYHSVRNDVIEDFRVRRQFTERKGTVDCLCEVLEGGHLHGRLCWGHQGIRQDDVIILLRLGHY